MGVGAGSAEEVGHDGPRVRALNPPRLHNPPSQADRTLHRLACLTGGVYFAFSNGCVARRG